jgi:hypothetical protein
VVIGVPAAIIVCTFVGLLSVFLWYLLPLRHRFRDPYRR